MGTRHYNFSGDKFFSFSRFLEHYISTVTSFTRNTTTAAKNYFGKLYERISSYEEVALDETGSILSWNRNFCMLEGYSEQEVLGQNINLFFTPMARQTRLAEQLLAKALASGTAVHFGELVRKDGTIFTGSLKLVRIRSKQKVLGFVALCRRVKGGKSTQNPGQTQRKI